MESWKDNVKLWGFEGTLLVNDMVLPEMATYGRDESLEATWNGA